MENPPQAQGQGPKMQVADVSMNKRFIYKN